MFKSRRSLLESIIKTGMTGIAVLAAAPLTSAAIQAPQPMPSPNAPRNQNVPAGLGGPDVTGPQKGGPGFVVNQDQIIASVEQLYRLVSELREDARHTNLNATFPVAFVKKAQQIEKLAKQIKDRAKG